MNTKHTPGPWVLGDSDLYCSSLSVHCGTRQGHTTICRMVSLEYGIGIGEVEANCRLISAAPELLEALIEAVDCGMVPTSSAKEGGAARHSRQVEVADMIRAAIAKATGGAQ